MKNILAFGKEAKCLEGLRICTMVLPTLHWFMEEEKSADLVEPRASLSPSPCTSKVSMLAYVSVVSWTGFPVTTGPPELCRQD